MNEDATRVLNPESEQSGQPTTKNGSNFLGRAAAAAAGVAVGSGATYAAGRIYDHATAAEEEQPEATAENQTATATNETAVGATVESVGVAQVDDSMSFSEAFAAARQQVGAGGVFEWHGKVYGTYYETEWNNMSQEQRADWQASIDYSEMASTSAQSSAHTQTATPAAHHAETHHAGSTHTADSATEGTGTVPSNASYVDNSASTSDADGEVRVVGVSIGDNGNGGVATMADLQIGGEMAVVVDVDTDGTIDIVAIDENHNGQFEQSEIHNAREANLATSDFIDDYIADAHAQGQQAVVTNMDDGSRYVISDNGSGYALTSADDDPARAMQANDMPTDDLPDYMNDADAGIMDA